MRLNTNPTSACLYTLVSIAALAALSGCTVTANEKIDYRSSTVAPSLEVPPDLTKLANDPRYQVPTGAVTATGFASGQAKPTAANTALNAIGDVRLERIGGQRYMVVARTPDQIWNLTRDFWTENGFSMVTDQQQVGVMETDWNENRAKIPQDALRRVLGSLAEGMFSSGERDKFRTRMERVAGGTEIFISHRGLAEVNLTANAASRVAAAQIEWRARPNDPELESEFLRRLMVKLGAPAERAAAVVAAPVEVKASSRVVTLPGGPAVEVDDGFDRAWRRVGLSLDRTGFTVEDRDRTNGVYFVRFATPGTEGKEPGFFAKLFKGDAGGPAPVKYRIALKTTGSKTVVSVLNASGEAEASENAQRITKLLADDLR